MAVGPEKSFRKQIADKPWDDSLRLVFADWLEDRGRVPEADATRAQRTVEFHRAIQSENGSNCVRMAFVLKGTKGVIVFVVRTHWYLSLTENQHGPVEVPPSAADFGYHSPVPIHAGQKPMNRPCEYMDGQKCYYDGSGIGAERVFAVLIREGHAGVWREMEAAYVDRFYHV